MELSIFMKQLESALIKRGIPSEIAHRHVSNIRRTFTTDDLSEIQSMHTADEIDALADSIASILKKNLNATAADNTQAVSNDSGRTEDARSSPQKRPVPYHPPKMTESKVVPKDDEEESLLEMNDDYFTYSNEEDPTTKGLTIFWVGLFVTLPITLGLLAVIFGAFAGLFVGLVAAIIFSIVIMIALVAAGAVVSLVGVIYGVTQLFSFPAAGIYEIGLGVMVAGIVLFASVLLYNLAVRLLPWLIKKVATLLVYVCKKLKLLFYYVRRECYKL